MKATVSKTASHEFGRGTLHVARYRAHKAKPSDKGRIRIDEREIDTIALARKRGAVQKQTEHSEHNSAPMQPQQKRRTSQIMASVRAIKQKIKRETAKEREDFKH